MGRGERLPSEVVGSTEMWPTPALAEEAEVEAWTMGSGEGWRSGRLWHSYREEKGAQYDKCGWIPKHFKAGMGKGEDSRLTSNFPRFHRQRARGEPAPAGMGLRVQRSYRHGTAGPAAATRPTAADGGTPTRMGFLNVL